MLELKLGLKKISRRAGGEKKKERKAGGVWKKQLTFCVLKEKEQ